MSNFVNLSLNIPAQGAKMSSDFIPIIGQHGINLKQFCDEFNRITENVTADILIRVKVIIYPNKTFLIKIKGFDLNYLLKYLLSLKENKVLNLLDIFLLYEMELRLHNLCGNFNFDKFLFLSNLKDKLDKRNINISFKEGDININ